MSYPTSRMLAAKIVNRFGLLALLKKINAGLRGLAAVGHKIQFEVEWRVSRPPEWFDHFTDQHWKWYFTRNSLSWERGVFGTLAMKPNARVLDLCCGGGFFAHHFFSGRASSVISVDFDPSAIEHAKRSFNAPNVEYRCADIRTQMPEGAFDNVVWDAAIEHFTEVEMKEILDNIKLRLGSTGTLSGYTLIERPEAKAHPDHEYEFKSKEDMVRILKPHFANVMVFETKTADVFEQRHNIYFYASDDVLPFDPQWPRYVRA